MRSRGDVVFDVTVLALRKNVCTVTYGRVVGQVRGTRRLNSVETVQQLNGIADHRATHADKNPYVVVHGVVAGHDPNAVNPDPVDNHSLVESRHGVALNDPVSEYPM